MPAISNRIHSGPATQEFTLEELSHSEEEVLPSSDPSTWKQLTPADSASIVLNGPPQNPPTSPRDSSECPFLLIFKMLPNGEKYPGIGLFGVKLLKDSTDIHSVFSKDAVKHVSL